MARLGKYSALLFLISVSTLYSQIERLTPLTAIDSCKQNYLYARAQYKAERDSVKILLKALRSLQSADSSSQKRITELEKALIQDSITVAKSETQIGEFKDREAQMQIEPLFKWNGFYTGLSLTYPFEDSVISRMTLLDGLIPSIEARGEVLIGGKLCLDGIVGIPLAKKKFYIKVYAGYRLF